MNFKQLLEFCQICPFCETPMPLYMKYLRLEREICLHDDVLSIPISGVGKLELDIKNNTWDTSMGWATNHNINSRNLICGRKCSCPGQVCWQTEPLSFNEDKTIAAIKITSLMFQKISQEEKIVVTSDYRAEHTSVSKYKWIPRFYIENKYFYKQFPLINFDFSSKEKIEDKLRMIMTFL